MVNKPGILPLILIVVLFGLLIIGISAVIVNIFNKNTVTVPYSKTSYVSYTNNTVNFKKSEQTGKMVDYNFNINN